MKKSADIFKNEVFPEKSKLLEKIRHFEKLSIYLKALQTRMQIDVNNFFIPQVVLKIYAKNTYFKNR